MTVDSKHLAVMLDVWINSHKNSKVAKCMRCNSTFRARELLAFPTLAERNIKDHNSNKFQFTKPKEIVYENVVDGVHIPYGPGDIVSLKDLPDNHPAVEYLKSRTNLNYNRLLEDFHASFCTKQRPESKELGIFYKKLPESRDTPQGRIVFMSYNNGNLEAWQSRVIDRSNSVSDLLIQSYLHPDSFSFTTTHCIRDKELMFVNPYQRKRDLPAKYYNGRYAKHRLVFGFDSYLINNSHIPYEDRVVFVTEGVTDAAQFGGMGVAILGKQLCLEQIPVLLRLAPKIIIASQHDKAADEGLKFNIEILTKLNIPFEVVSPPQELNDFGEMHYEQVQQQHIYDCTKRPSKTNYC